MEFVIAEVRNIGMGFLVRLLDFTIAAHPLQSSVRRHGMEPPVLRVRCLKLTIFILYILRNLMLMGHLLAMANVIMIMLLAIILDSIHTTNAQINAFTGVQCVEE